MDKEMIEKFNSFLVSEDSVCLLKKDKKNYKICKIPYGQSMDILYSTYEYDDYLEEKLVYSGMYNRENNKLYDLGYNISYSLLEYSYTNDKFWTESDLVFREINDKLNDIAKNFILDNSKIFYESVENDWKSSIKESDVYSNFINGDEKIEINSNFNINDNKFMLDYLDKGDEFLYDYTHEYLMKMKSEIGKCLLNIDKKTECLTGIINDKNHRMHKVKDIHDSIKDIDCNTVNIFINKDGLNFDFKYEKDTLLTNYDYSSIYTWYIPAKERREFENLYGRNAEIKFDDITKIEYRNKIIYLDRNFDNNKEDCEEISL